MPGPAEQALRGWFTLHRMGLPWSPDSIDLAQLDPVQIAIHRAHTIDLEAIIEKVANRGGPAAPGKWNLRNTEQSSGHWKLASTVCPTAVLPRSLTVARTVLLICRGTGHYTPASTFALSLG